MGPEGEDAAKHLMRKYRISAEQLAQNRQVIVERGAGVGFAFGTRSRIWNTFDAHRLLHWAGLQGGDHQRRLKHALLAAYHTRGENPGAHEVLLRAATEAGLDATQAAEVMDSGRYADEVRERERFYQQLGIHSVPSVIVDDRHLIQGGQPPEVFEQALRQIAAGG
jgi:predicted DsbA family dithiol-disulfide isomerase